eukprot:6483458-Amphidinium_carterae.1
MFNNYVAFAWLQLPTSYRFEFDMECFSAQWYLLCENPRLGAVLVSSCPSSIGVSRFCFVPSYAMFPFPCLDPKLLGTCARQISPDEATWHGGLQVEHASGRAAAHPTCSLAIKHTMANAS